MRLRQLFRDAGVTTGWVLWFLIWTNISAWINVASGTTLVVQLVSVGFVLMTFFLVVCACAFGTAKGRMEAYRSLAQTVCVKYGHQIPPEGKCVCGEKVNK